LAAETSLPLVCCGDWCGGSLISSAIVSGIAAAENINSKLQQRELPGVNFLDTL
ncbi:MAG: FAD-dependent oxidoreductase, partial [Cyanobacteria bacterium P01_D01_bin.116]